MRKNINKVVSKVGNLKPIVIAIAGATCSGKSTAADDLSKQGYKVINVDKFAHTLYLKGTPLYNVLKKKYGAMIINDHGEINRKILGAKVLSGTKVYYEYCDIVYPKLNQALEKAIKNLGVAVVILDMAVVFESGFYKKTNAVIYVQASESILKKAMLKRGNASFSLKIMKVQTLFPVSKKIALSDYVVYNNSNIEELKKKTRKAVLGTLEGLKWSKGQKRTLARKIVIK